MLITVRAYQHSDLDLILLGRAMGRNYSGFIRECLRCYLRGVPLRAGIPTLSFVSDGELKGQMMQTAVTLKESEDADVIAMMKNIRDRYKNNFVKNIVRMYTATQCIAAYANNSFAFAHLSKSAEERLRDTGVLPVPNVPKVKRVYAQPFIPRPKYKSEVVSEEEVKASATAMAKRTPVSVPVATAPVATVSTPVLSEQPVMPVTEAPVSLAEEVVSVPPVQTVPTVANTQSVPEQSNTASLGAESSWGDIDTRETISQDDSDKIGAEEDALLDAFLGIIG